MRNCGLTHQEALNLTGCAMKEEKVEEEEEKVLWII